MPRPTLEFRVVVASPSDVYEARKAIFDTLHELNRAFEIQRVSLRALGWEEYASPGVDTDAQHLISDQILREYDVLIAVFGTKLGSPTQSAPSGTVEEIEHAISKQDSQMGKFRVQVYFSDRIESLSSVSVDELKKLEAYRSSLKERGVLYRTYKNEDELRREVRVNLQRSISEYLAHRAQAPVLPGAQPSTPHQSLQASTPVIAAQEDFGLLDQQEKAERAIAAANASIEAMSVLMQEINAETNRNVAEVERISSPLVSTSEKKKVFNSFAEFLKEKAEKLMDEAASARSSFAEFFDALTILIDLDREFSSVERHQIAITRLLEAATALSQIVRQGRVSTITFKQTIESLPRITIQFNQAKKLLTGALNECIEVFEQTERGLSDLSATN